MIFTDEQQAAIETFGKHLCVNAGAGSGKTRVLVERIVQLLREDRAKLNQIVAITFTRKAAAEMRKRLRERFHDLVPKDNPQEATKWLNNIRDLDSARITTIDSFCSGLLRDFGLWVNDDPDFAMMTEADQKTIPIQIVLDELERLLAADDPAATRFVSAVGMYDARERLTGMLGQSTLHRWLDKYAEGTLEDLAAAWREMTVDLMREVIQSAGDALGAHGRNGSKYSAFLEAVSVLRVKCADDLLDEGFLESMAELADGSFRGARAPKDCDPADYEALKTAANEAKSVVTIVTRDLRDAAYVEASLRLTKDFADVFVRIRAAYQAHKRTHSLKDFNDLLTESLAMLEQQEELRVRVAGSIRHLLMDEFQDTNAAQWGLAKRLMRTDSQEGAELFIVGDAKQSIYRFRNAQVEVFQQAQADLDDVLQLRMNFRTVSNAMDAINRFFEQTDLLEKVASPWDPLQSSKCASDAPGMTVLIEPVPKDGNADENRAAEAGHIARHIHALCSGDSARAYGDFAMLFRAKSNIHIYESALRDAGVPFETFGGNQFFFRQEITDLINALRVAHDPHDEQALLAVLRSPMVGLDDNSVVRLGWRRGLANGVYSEIPLPDAGQQARLNRARAWLRELQGQRLNAVECVQRVLQTTDYEAVLGTLPYGEQRINNVRKFQDTAREFVGSGRHHLYQFIHHLGELTQHEIVEEDAPHFGERRNAVSLMSIHASKGLEFPYVILPDTSAQKSGNSGSKTYSGHTALGVSIAAPKHGETLEHAFDVMVKRRNSEDDAAEEARVLYVAMTRTERQLIVSGTLNYEETEAGRVYSVPVSSSTLAHFDGVFGVTEGVQQGAASLDEQRNVALIVGDEGDAGRQAAPREKKSARKASASEWMPVDVATESGRYRSVSQWLDEQAGEIGSGDGFSPAQYRAARRGTIAHAFLEQWDFAADAPDVQTFLMQQYPERVRDAELRGYLEGMAERLKASALMGIVAEEGRLRRELPFTVQRGDIVISGTIDAVTEQGTLIDYKSGQHRADSQERYAMQLGLYADALESLTGARPKRGVIYYLDSGDVSEVALS